MQRYFIHGDNALGISLDRLRNLAERYLRFAALVNQYIDFRFVLEEAPKYEIMEIDFEDPDYHGLSENANEYSWRDGAFAKIHRPMDSSHYVLHFNPNLDRKEAARTLSIRTGMRIRPEEVYYYTWFHECGHTRKVSGALAPEKLFAMNFKIGWKDPETGHVITRESLRERRARAEMEADAWAIREFRKWRRGLRKKLAEEKGCLPGLRGFLEQAG